MKGRTQKKNCRKTFKRKGVKVSKAPKDKINSEQKIKSSLDYEKTALL
jgi:hypothetical protein